MLELALASPALFEYKIFQICTQAERAMRKNLFDGVLALLLIVDYTTLK
jgi:hypothetical protein